MGVPEEKTHQHLPAPLVCLAGPWDHAGDCIDTAEAAQTTPDWRERASGDDLPVVCHVNTPREQGTVCWGQKCECSFGFTEDLLCTYRIVTGSGANSGHRHTSLTPGRDR